MLSEEKLKKLRQDLKKLGNEKRKMQEIIKTANSKIERLDREIVDIFKILENNIG